MNSSTQTPVIKRHLLTIFFSCMVLVLGAQLSQAQEEMTPVPMISGIEMLKIGDTGPDFSVGDLTGAPFTMNEVLGAHKGVLIFFWSIFCEPCKAELPAIQELTDKYGEKGFAFVGVALDGAPMKDAIAAFINMEEYSFKVLIDELNPDESFKVSDPYGVAGTPTVYILDGMGVVQFAKVGRASVEELDAVISNLP
jgi:peroxiredoxin